MYRRRFLVDVELTPGTGYENSLPPGTSLLRGAIKRAMFNGLNPSKFITSKVLSVKPIAIHRRPRAGRKAS